MDERSRWRPDKKAAEDRSKQVCASTVRAWVARAPAWPWGLEPTPSTLSLALTPRIRSHHPGLGLSSGRSRTGLF